MNTSNNSTATIVPAVTDNNVIQVGGDSFLLGDKADGSKRLVAEYLAATYGSDILNSANKGGFDVRKMKTPKAAREHASALDITPKKLYRLVAIVNGIFEASGRKDNNIRQDLVRLLNGRVEVDSEKVEKVAAANACKLVAKAATATAKVLENKVAIATKLGDEKAIARAKQEATAASKQAEQAEKSYTTSKDALVAYNDGKKVQAKKTTPTEDAIAALSKAYAILSAMPTYSEAMQETGKALTLLGVDLTKLDV